MSIVVGEKFHRARTGGIGLRPQVKALADNIHGSVIRARVGFKGVIS